MMVVDICESQRMDEKELLFASKISIRFLRRLALASC